MDDRLYRVRRAGCIVAALLAAFGVAPASAATPAIVPVPASVVELPGDGVDLGPTPRFRVLPGDRNARAAAEELRGRLIATTALRPVVSESARSLPGDVLFTSGPGGAGDEGYALSVGEGSVTVRAPTSAGLFYGSMTLWQLLTDQPGTGAHLAAMRITDQPRFAWRGLMLDSARHMQSVSYVEQFIDWMAVHKLNTLHWHLADDQGWRIEIKRYPRLTSVGAWRTAVGPDATDAQGRHLPRYGGFYTQAQIRAIVAFAATRHVTIVPEIDMPGHSTALIAAYPALGVRGFPAEPVTADYGLLPEVLNTDDATFATVENILGEVMELFPSRYIHLGGDEVDHSQWHASPAEQARMHAVGLRDEAALERWFIGRLGRFLESHGRRLVGWDEIQEGASGAGLDRDAVIMSWHGGDGAAKAVTSGHDVVIAQAPIYYLDNRQVASPAEPPSWSDVITLEQIYRHDPVPAGLTPAEQRHILGVQGQIWTERARKEAWVTQLVYPRAAALAEVGWSPASRLDWPDFAARMAVQRRRYAAMNLAAGDERREAIDAPEAAVRSSVDLDFCEPNTTGLMLEQPYPVPSETPLVKVAMRRPCWVYRGADLSSPHRLDVSAVHLPYNERLGSKAPILTLPPSKVRGGAIEVHLDRADGPLAAEFPLTDWRASAARRRFAATLDARGGRHDLFLVLTGPSIDTRVLQRPPLTIVDRVELGPAAGK